MLKEILSDLLKQAIAKAQENGKLPIVPLPDIVIERPQKTEHGDYASSISLKLARAIGTNPMAIAKEIAACIPATAEIGAVSVAPPGFINFTLSKTWLACQVDNILKAANSYGNITYGAGKKVQIEFVSVNPTGPLHIGHGRGAILGSALANALSAAGFNVEKEYYVNDAGTQIDTFYRSLWARYQQQFEVKVDVPTDGYVGAYMIDVAKEIIVEQGDRFMKLPEKEAIAALGKIGLEKMIGKIRADLETLRVTFDVWFSEKSLYANGQYATAMKLLRDAGYLTEKEGATWFVSTALGESKDNVVIRSDGTPTYFAADIAYHYNKLVERKFDQVIDIWGADHAGHVSRMKAVLTALGLDPERLDVILGQMVTLRRGGELVKISKRSGEIITLQELVEEVGADACRFFFLCRSADSQMDFDMELAKKQSSDNPVYYVQYAHARISSILKLAKEHGIDYSQGDVSLLCHDPEQNLIRKMITLPEMIEVIAKTLEPHHLTYYAQDLATVFHAFYKDCRVMPSQKSTAPVTDEEMAVTKARLKLVEAAQTVLGRTLNLMGMTAPDKM